jgi:hypothetical protein
VLPLGNLTGNNLLSIMPKDKPFCVTSVVGQKRPYEVTSKPANEK